MNNFIHFLLLIAICVTIYVVADDHIGLRDQMLQQISAPFKVAHSVTALPKHSQTNNILNGFEANGTEPFWAAELSGNTLTWQSPDLGIITISWLIWPAMSGASQVWTDTGSATTVIITPWSCNNGMSEQVFSGSINLVITGQNLQWCVSY
jgi:uncharacterized membrane protein